MTGPTFKAFRRGRGLVIRGAAPVSAFFAGPYLARELSRDDAELLFRFRYQRTLHQRREPREDQESLEEFTVEMPVIGSEVKRIRIRIEGTADVVIESRSKG